MLRAEHRGTCPRVWLFGYVRPAPVFDPCCHDDLRRMLMQFSIICLLLASMGTTAIIKHPAWFGGIPVGTQSLTER